MVSTRRSGSLSGNNSKRSSSSEDRPPSPKRHKVFVGIEKSDCFSSFHLFGFFGRVKDWVFGGREL